jgi:hypothetical protein
LSDFDIITITRFRRFVIIILLSLGISTPHSEASGEHNYEGKHQNIDILDRCHGTACALLTNYLVAGLIWWL